MSRERKFIKAMMISFFRSKP